MAPRATASSVAADTAAASAALRAADIDLPCRDIGVPQRFLDHAARNEILDEIGLTEQNVARQITGWVAALAVGDESVAQQVD
jgi:1-deoxy-D-xylulose-5-phosphate synthase